MSRPTVQAAQKTFKSISQAKESLVRTALQPRTFRYVDQLTNYVKEHFILHEPGRFLIIPKPYGISCLGHKSAGGGVFKSSVYKDQDKDEVLPTTSKNDIVLEECIPALARAFHEPKLHFCVGLKRYLSGSIVLPARDEEYKNITNSIKFMNQVSEGDYHYRALTILLGTLPESSGTVTGYATFHKTGEHSEYVFVPGKAMKREKSGKFAVGGAIEYTVLTTKFGCSLVEFGTNKFARHLPRLAFTSLMCPILGDPLYSKRLLDVDGSPVLVKPGQGGKQWFPKQLSERLGLPSSQLHKELPLFCHVYQTAFPRYGWEIGKKGSQQEDMDLLASAPPPEHFLAMAEALQMDGALNKFLRDEVETNFSDL